MLNKGLVTVTASPGEKGEMANIECVPASSYYTVTNETQSRTPSAGRFGVSRDWLQNGNNVIIKGNVESKRIGTVNILSPKRGNGSPYSPASPKLHHQIQDHIHRQRICHPSMYPVQSLPDTTPPF